METTRGAAMSPNAPNRQLRTPTGSTTPHVLLWIFQILALASPPFQGRRTVFAIVIIVLFCTSQVEPHCFNDLALAQPLSIEWANALSTLEKILFSAPPGPESSLWRIDKPAGEALSFRAFGINKLRWAFVILVNLRGIRWNYQVKNVPVVRAMRRRQWVLIQVANFAYYTLMADLMVHLGIRFFYSTPDGQVGMVNSKYLKLGHSDPRWSFIKALVFGATPYYLLSMQYTMFSIVAVFLGISEPKVCNETLTSNMLHFFKESDRKLQDWPAHFGRLRDATTLRDFWGKYWHQTVRKVGFRETRLHMLPDFHRSDSQT